MIQVSNECRLIMASLKGDRISPAVCTISLECEMAPKRTKSFRSFDWKCCGLRRKIVTSKLMPIFFQVFVVVVVWYVIKRHERNVICKNTKSEKDSEETTSLLNSNVYNRKGTSLKLQDIVSSSSMSESYERQNVKYILKMDILVRDVDSQALVMYPKGIPFVLGSEIPSKSVGVDMSEFYYDNSVEEEDLDKVIVDGTETQYGDSVNKENLSKHHILDSIYNDSTELSLNDAEADADSRGQDGFAVVVGNNLGGDIQSENAILKEDKQKDPNVPQNMISATNNQSISYQRDSQFVPLQETTVMQVQGANVMLPQNQQSPGIVQMPPNQPQSFGVTENINLADNSEEYLYTSGFKERVNMFKSELYGRSLEDSSHYPNIQYLLNNANACESLENVDLLFLIHSLPQSEDLRERIRTTFVQRDILKPFNVVYVFLVGKTTSPNFQANLNKDSEIYNDIVQGDFLDKSDTQTQKGLMGMIWTLSFCSKTKIVLKIEQDVFVDSEKLLKGLIPTMNQVVGNRAMLCFYNPDAQIPRSGPNAVSADYFPNSSKLRPYCKGFAVLMTRETVTSLIAASKHVPFCPLDDMFLYGILPYIAGGIEVYDSGNKRAFHDYGMAVVSCYQELQNKCPYVITKAYSSRFSSLWEMVKARAENGEEISFEGQFLWDIRSWRV